MKSILIDDALHQKLKMYCVKNKIQINDTIREAIDKICAGEFIVVPAERPKLVVNTKSSPIRYCKHASRVGFCKYNCK